MKVVPVVLEGEHVRLEPLSFEHAPQILAAAAHPEIWRWMPFALLTEEQIQQFITIASKMAAAGGALPFALVLKGTNQLIGGTGFGSIEPYHRKLEIGGTWITPQWQRTVANTEMKYLMLKHAFEHYGCRRVGFMVHEKNHKSRSAVLRLGAKEEGLLRNHLVMLDGGKRHSVSFSIIEEEWPETKRWLEQRLGVQIQDKENA